MFTAFSGLWSGPADLCDVTRGLGIMWYAGDASDVDGERLERAQRGVSEGALIGHSACWARSYGHVAGSVRA